MSSSEPMFLGPQDLEELTGHSRAAIQMRWLRSKTIPFIVGGDGRPKVARQTLLALLDPARKDADSGEQVMPGLNEITENWDKVSEELMAELMGLTARALQGRRARGKIPTDIWREIDGRIMYSMKRYDAWLEGYWPPMEKQVDINSRSARAKMQRKKRAPVYKLV